MKSYLTAKTIILTGVALWLSILVFNNIVDADTNILNIHTMLTMSLLKQDPNVGLGLRWRAWPDGYAGPVLTVVVVYQVIVMAALWYAASRFLAALRGRITEARAIAAANVALSLLALLWLGFLSGGSWLGYWIKQGPITGVHMNMLMLSIVLLIFVNHRSADTATGA